MPYFPDRIMPITTKMDTPIFGQNNNAIKAKYYNVLDEELVEIEKYLLDQNSTIGNISQRINNLVLEANKIVGRQSFSKIHSGHCITGMRMRFPEATVTWLTKMPSPSDRTITVNSTENFPDNGIITILNDIDQIVLSNNTITRKINSGTTFVEWIKYRGKTINSFLNCERGILGTYVGKHAGYYPGSNSITQINDRDHCPSIPLKTSGQICQRRFSAISNSYYFPFFDFYGTLDEIKKQIMVIGPSKIFYFNNVDYDKFKSTIGVQSSSPVSSLDEITIKTGIWNEVFCNTNKKVLIPKIPGGGGWRSNDKIFEVYRFPFVPNAEGIILDTCISSNISTEDFQFLSSNQLVSSLVQNSINNILYHESEVGHENDPYYGDWFQDLRNECLYGYCSEYITKSNGIALSWYDPDNSCPYEMSINPKTGYPYKLQVTNPPTGYGSPNIKAWCCHNSQKCQTSPLDVQMAMYILYRMYQKGWAIPVKEAFSYYGYLVSEDSSYAANNLLTADEAEVIVNSSLENGLIKIAEQQYIESGIPVFCGRLNVAHGVGCWTNNLPGEKSKLTPEFTKIVQYADGTLMLSLDPQNLITNIGQSVVTYSTMIIPSE